MAQVRTAITLDAIKAIVEQIVSRFRPQRIILFGSQAWGTPTPDSDVDLMVIMETEGNPIHAAARVSAAVDHPFPLDILVETPTYFAEALAEEDIFETQIANEGIVLYEAKNQRVD
jgi:predicted nucleotidyltransferase